MSLKFCIIMGSNSQKNFFANQHGRRDVTGKPRIAIQGPVSRKSRKLFGPEKPFVKLRIANFAKLVFSYVVKGKQLKKAAGFRASRRLRFEDAKRIMSPETRPTWDSYYIVYWPRSVILTPLSSSCLSCMPSPCVVVVYFFCLSVIFFVVYWKSW